MRAAVVTEARALNKWLKRLAEAERATPAYGVRPASDRQLLKSDRIRDRAEVAAVHQQVGESDASKRWT